MSRIVASVPMLGALAAVTTVVLAYKATMDRHQLPDFAVTPPISLLGCQDPARTIYAVGFVITGIYYRWDDTESR